MHQFINLSDIIVYEKVVTAGVLLLLIIAIIYNFTNTYCLVTF